LTKIRSDVNIEKNMEDATWQPFADLWPFLRFACSSAYASGSLTENIDAARGKPGSHWKKKRKKTLPAKGMMTRRQKKMTNAISDAFRIQTGLNAERRALRRLTRN
jgi:hypothetical protein